MSPGKHSNIPVFFLGAILMLGFAAPPVLAGTIRAVIEPSKSQPAPGEQITIAIAVDVSQSPALLGSYTATLKWNPGVLKFVHHTGGATPAFANPVVNKRETGQGRLFFAHAYPHGGTGVVNLLNITFEVIGSEGSDSDLNIEFSAMSAALTFEDLLPQLEPLVTAIKDRITVVELPKTYELRQNHPNPFNPETEIRYELPKKSLVTLAVYNLLGQKIAMLVNGTLEAGKYSVRWNGVNDSGKNVPSGIYIYRMEAEGFIAEKKMTLVR